MRRILLGFAPYAVVSVIHVIALAAGAEAVAAPTKLWLMPLLVVAVLWGGRGSRWGGTYMLLFVAIAFSWLGDSAGTFFPAAPTVPMMLLFFGLAHLCYIWIFWRRIPVRRVPMWAVVYGVWWVALLAILWPSLGSLLLAVAVYGLVLGGTAVAASRCHPLVAAGGAFFLASDTILAFRLFTPDAMPDWTSPLVMLTYCLGQGLIAAGVIVSDRLQEARSAAVRVAA
ncbi:lysoplasmalogenase [uncultured Microbacterium sp.]|uniref:lysoplasmalogenase n=1 Tax=uncultured Microbacterium sp. TaxID=191216 RepID=UPI0028D1E7A8|nr:lysoplasmalogenase [uncultured Microbacterium sp.]